MEQKQANNSLTCLQGCCGGKRLKSDCAEISVSDQSPIFNRPPLKKKNLLKLIAVQFQKNNYSNVTFLCEHSYVPASPDQAFSKEVTSTDVIKSQDYFQHFPLSSGRCEAWFCTSAVNFTAMV